MVSSFIELKIFCCSSYFATSPIFWLIQYLNCFLYAQGINLALPMESGIVPSVVLGLLLVFRTNTAYDRFWEGRKLWGVLINTVRNLDRTIFR